MPDVNSRQMGVAPASSRAGRVLLALALVAATLLGARGLGDEGMVSLQGDMPRYLMNGVFIRDFLSHPSFSVDGILTYAQHYFARYPALSIGHHPPLLPILLVPFYLVFGVSVWAGRLASVGCFVLAVWLLYTLARRQYNVTVAGWAALVFATQPFVVLYGQVVMSEMPTIMLVLAAFNYLLRFRDHGRVGDYLIFVGLAGASLAAKQLGAFLFPAYVVLLFLDGGWSRLKKRSVMTWTVAGAILTVPLVVVTLILSPYNVGIVLDVLERGVGLAAWREIVNPIRIEHLTPAMLTAVLVSLGVAVVTRDRRIWLGVVWALSVIAGVVFITGPYDVARYAIYAVPAYCLISASLIAHAAPARQYVLASLLLAVVVASQTPAALSARPVGARGYEEAARFVLSDTTAPTVLYSASVDTGYFVFFVRKHDPAQRLVVLRSDKILTTSFMNDMSLEERIDAPADIYPVLDKYGTRYVVIEDRPSGFEVIDWLRTETKGDRFIERQRLPIGTADRRLAGVDLVVYEYRDAKPGDPDAELDMRLPLVGREIKVKLSDLQPTVAR